jgi:hypothetical protein
MNNIIFIILNEYNLSLIAETSQMSLKFFQNLAVEESFINWYKTACNRAR